MEIEVKAASTLFLNIHGNVCVPRRIKMKLRKLIRFIDEILMFEGKTNDMN